MDDRPNHLQCQVDYLSQTLGQGPGLSLVERLRGGGRGPVRHEGQSRQDGQEGDEGLD
jgi:hypothetical protein